MDKYVYKKFYKKPTKATKAKPAPSDEEMEDSLLNGDGRADTPAPTPPGTPPNGKVNGGESKAVTPDAIEKRCQQIFGKRPATGDITDTGTSAKVVNVEAEKTDNKSDPVAVTAPDNTQAIAKDNLNVNNNGDNSKAAVKDPKGNIDAGDDSKPVDMDVSDDDGNPVDANGRVDPWAVANEAPPILYPTESFPTEPPQYPAQPSFNYRYRAGAGSTPRRRRQDFTRAIVLRNVKRDPHTNRVSNEDYEAREDSEMQLSLGCVTHNIYDS